MERRIGNLEFIRSVVDQLSANDIVFLKIWIFLADQTVLYLEKVFTDMQYISLVILIQ